MPTKTRRVNCLICTENSPVPTFRNTDILRHFISGQNKILPRRKTGTCSYHQRRLSQAIKQSREMGLLGYRGQ